VRRAAKKKNSKGLRTPTYYPMAVVITTASTLFEEKRKTIAWSSMEGERERERERE
jgi:hypothetical protein